MMHGIFLEVFGIYCRITKLVRGQRRPQSASASTCGIVEEPYPRSYNYMADGAPGARPEIRVVSSPPLSFYSRPWPSACRKVAIYCLLEEDAGLPALPTFRSWYCTKWEDTRGFHFEHVTSIHFRTSRANVKLESTPGDASWSVKQRARGGVVWRNVWPTGLLWLEVIPRGTYCGRSPNSGQ